MESLLAENVRVPETEKCGRMGTDKIFCGKEKVTMMKQYMKWHKYSSVVMMISALAGLCSGGTKAKKFHRWSVFFMVISSLICIWSGHKMAMPEEGAEVSSDEEVCGQEAAEVAAETE